MTECECCNQPFNEDELEYNEKYDQLECEDCRNGIDVKKDFIDERR